MTPVSPSTFVYFLAMQLTSCRISYSTTGGLFFYCPLDEEQSIRADPLRECLFVGTVKSYAQIQQRHL